MHRITSPLTLAVSLIALSPLAMAIEPDPVELLNNSATTIANAESATATIRAQVRIVMGEDTVEDITTFSYARGTAPSGAAFSLVPDASSDAFEVRAAGNVFTLHVPSIGKYTINQAEAPLATFVQTPIAAGLANGLGGLALALVDPTATAELAEKITASDYLGEVELNGETLHHCQYVVEEDLTVDVWFATGDAQVVRRLSPNLSEMAATSPLAAQHDNFEYTITFVYTDWNLDAGLSAESFRLSEPADAELVESFMRRRERGPHPMIGADAPPFVLATPEGEQVNLDDHLGKDVVMLDFWATWCPPCVAALPKIDQVADSFADKGVAFYAVNQDETAEEVLSFLEARELDTSVVLDDGGAAARSYGVRGLPTSVLIGKDGRVQVVHVGVGPNFEQSLATELESLVNGEDLAAEAIAEREAAEAARVRRLGELRALLETAL